MSTSNLDTSDGRVRRAQGLRKRRRAALLRAAAHVFAQKGYHAGSISDIIEAAGVARGTFYLYFEGKRPLFEEIIDSVLRELQDRIRPVDLELAEPASEQMYGNVRRVLQLFEEERDLLRIVLRQAGVLDDAFEQRLDQFYHSVLQLLTTSLEVGMSMGIVRKVNAKRTAPFILGSLKEALTATFLDSPSSDQDLDEVAADILQYILFGVFAPDGR